MSELSDDGFAMSFIIVAAIAYLIGGTWPYWGKASMDWFRVPTDAESMRRFYHACKVIGIGICLLAMSLLNTLSTYLGQKEQPIHSGHLAVAILEAIVAVGLGVMAGLQWWYKTNNWSRIGLFCAAAVVIYKFVALGYVANHHYDVQVYGASAAFFATVGGILPYYESAWDSP